MLKVALCVAAVVLFAGCATSIDWNSRIGTYTFDDAIMELGPPHRQTMLSDGRIVAEWITRHVSSGTTTVVGGGGFHGGGAMVIQGPPRYWDRILRLTFSTNDVLVAWSRN